MVKIFSEYVLIWAHTINFKIFRIFHSSRNFFSFFRFFLFGLCKWVESNLTKVILKKKLKRHSFSRERKIFFKIIHVLAYRLHTNFYISTFLNNFYCIITRRDFSTKLYIGFALEIYCSREIRKKPSKIYFFQKFVF